MSKHCESLSNYDCTTAVAKFYNRDKENSVGFEMRMTHTEYNALCRFLEKLGKDVAERARESVAAQVRQALQIASPSQTTGDRQ